MAVTTTAQDIIEAAYAKSMKSRPGTIANEEVELLGRVNRLFSGYYAAAVRINPTFFSETQAVAYSSPGWQRPQEAEAVFRIENASGTEVKIVPHDDRTIAHPKPAVYRLGGIYRGAGNANDPTSGSLTFFYSRRPDVLTSLSQTLDSQWTEQFNELPILDLAIALATKDPQAGREREAQEYREQRTAVAAQFAAFLEHETVGTITRFGHVRRFNAPSIAALGSLIPGSADFQVGS